MSFFTLEALMRILTPLLVLPKLIVFPQRVVPSALLQAAHASVTAAADTTESVRWNRLVPRIVDEASARRRAARAAAKAAGDSAALRRIAQNQLPILFRVYTLLSVAQYGAVNSARDDRGVSPEVAIASASAEGKRATA